jgi:hypothetical protein
LEAGDRPAAPGSVGTGTTHPTTPARKDWSAPAVRPRSRRRLVLYIGVAVVVVAVISATAVSAGWFARRAPCDPTISGIWATGQYAVIEPCGTHVTVAPGAPVTYSAGRYTDAQIMLGKYSSSSPIGSYLLNMSEFTNLTQHPDPPGPPAGWFWSCGPVATTCNVNADVPPSPSEYFLVLIDFGSSPASVVWSLSLLVAYVYNN